MKTLRKVVSVLLAVLIAGSAAVCSSALEDGDIFEASFNSCIENPDELQNVTGIKNQMEDTADDESCIAYAFISTAESFAIKNLDADKSKTDFDESVLIKGSNSSDNYGEVVFDSVDCALGNGYYVTGLENITERSERYIKKKILENGAVCAAAALPEGGLTNNIYYSEENACFFCPEKETDGKTYHAFSVIGWDDNYYASNFKTSPGIKGAWICKNSYGDEFGENGYFRLSYRTGFYYASAVEVSRLDGLKAIRKVDSILSFFGIGKIAGLGFTSGKEYRDGEVKAFLNGKEIRSSVENIKKGYNFIALDNPVKSGSVKITVNGEEIPLPSIRCYIASCKLKESEPEEKTGWLEETKKIRIDLTGDKPTAQTEEYLHKAYYNSTDNCCYITPYDGFFFTENLYITRFDSEYYGGSPVHYHDITLAEYAADGFKPEITLLDDGRLKIQTENIGGALLTNVGIVTDSGSRITSVDIGLDNSSETAIEIKPENIKLYKSDGLPSLNFPGKEVSSVKGLGEYYAVIEIEGYYCDGSCTVTITNGSETKTVNCEIYSDGTKTVIGILIDIPSVIATIDEAVRADGGNRTNIITVIFGIIGKLIRALFD